METIERFPFIQGKTRFVSFHPTQQRQKSNELALIPEQIIFNDDSSVGRTEDIVLIRRKVYFLDI